jgi:hypothetical protein
MAFLAHFGFLWIPILIILCFHLIIIFIPFFSSLLRGRSTRLPYGGGVAVELIIKTKQRVFKKEGRRKIFFLSLNINKLGMLNKYVFFSSIGWTIGQEYMVKE